MSLKKNLKHKRKFNLPYNFFMLTGTLLLLLLGFGCNTSKLQTATTKKQPNFIVIFTDDLGYGDLSCFGNPTIKTPHLDKMAQEGQKWTQFYVAAPICTASRAGLLTGRYPIRNGMTSAKRAVLFPNSPGGLPQQEVTIAEVLKQKNYATAAIGKWHLGHLPQHLPNTQGFDYYYGIPYSNDMDFVKGAPSYWHQTADPNYYSDPKYFNVPLLENGKQIERPVDQNTITKRYTEKAIEYIKQHKNQPFFIYLAHSLPHIPLFAHKDFVGKSTQGLYGDVIEEIDWSVGQILETLRAQKLAENTIVVFSSDNGPWLAFKTHGGSAGPLRAGKGTTFEGGQRVPTIFWGPKQVQPGIINEMGATLDLINTFAAMADAPLPTDRKMDGYNLAPVLTGQSLESPRKEFFYWTRAKLHAARLGKWKLHIAQRPPVDYRKATDLEQPELYNLHADISEKYDRAKAMPEKVEALKTLIATHQADVADALPDNLAGFIEK
jgi:arylsulfatase A-like enzyme